MSAAITLVLEPVGTGEDQKMEVRLVNPAGGYLVLIASKKKKAVMAMHARAKALLDGK